jgi:hypothetical protein
MASRAELELRAASANVNPASYQSDSRLEQAVIYAENQRTSTSTATTLAPTALAKRQHGGANV